MYADYEFYSAKYLGELVSEDDYPKYEMKARDVTLLEEFL